MQDFINKSSELINKFENFIERNNLQDKFILDHICYKCGGGDEYEQIRKMFEQESKFIYQAIISNRRISVIRFTNPINTKYGEIKFLELADQKIDNSQESLFDHIEIILKEESVEDFIEKIKSTENIKHSIRPHHTTYDVYLDDKLNIRLSMEMLLDKIKREEMN